MRAIRRIAYKVWVGLGGRRRLISPSKLGPGPHDCAQASVYQVVPSIPEARIVQAVPVPQLMGGLALSS